VCSVSATHSMLLSLSSTISMKFRDPSIQLPTANLQLQICDWWLSEICRGPEWGLASLHFKGVSSHHEGLAPMKVTAGLTIPDAAESISGI